MIFLQPFFLFFFFFFSEIWYLQFWRVWAEHHQTVSEIFNRLYGILHISWEYHLLLKRMIEICYCAMDPVGNHLKGNPRTLDSLSCRWQQRVYFLLMEMISICKGFNHICSLWEFDAENFWYLAIKIQRKNCLNFQLKILGAWRFFSLVI